MSSDDTNEGGDYGTFSKLNPNQTRYQVTSKARRWYERQDLGPNRNQWPQTPIGCFLWAFRGTLANETAVNDLSGKEIQEILNHYKPAQMAHYSLGISHIPEWIRWAMIHDWICPAQRYVWTDLTRLMHRQIYQTYPEAQKQLMLPVLMEMFQHTDSNFRGVSIADIQWRLRHVKEEFEDIDPQECKTRLDWQRYIAYNARHVINALISVGSLQLATRYKATPLANARLVKPTKEEEKETEKDEILCALLWHFHSAGKQGVLPACAIATYAQELDTTVDKLDWNLFLIDAWVAERVREGLLEAVVDPVFERTD
jgi:hypothetical protein